MNKTMKQCQTCLSNDCINCEHRDRDLFIHPTWLNVVERLKDKYKEQK